MDHERLKTTGLESPKRSVVKAEDDIFSTDDQLSLSQHHFFNIAHSWEHLSAV